MPTSTGSKTTENIDFNPQQLSLHLTFLLVLTLLFSMRSLLQNSEKEEGVAWKSWRVGLGTGNCSVGTQALKVSYGYDNHKVSHCFILCQNAKIFNCKNA